MSIPNSRASGVAEVLIDYSLCTVCGICLDVCKGGPLYIDNHRLMVDQALDFGCIACGACAAACPTDAIRISGRDLFPADVMRIPRAENRASFEALNNLLLSRRSTRNFMPREVEPEVVQKILDAASTAPMGIPPTDIGVLVFNSSQAVRELRTAMLQAMAYWPRIFTPFMSALMRPFIGKENAAMFRDFIGPAVKSYIEKDKQGIDWFTYNAPLAFYFYGTPYSDPADASTAATLAMLAGESLGLGTCLLGFPGYVFSYSKKVRKKFALPAKIPSSMMVVMGYPKYHNRNSLRRRFREVLIIP